MTINYSNCRTNGLHFVVGVISGMRFGMYTNMHWLTTIFWTVEHNLGVANEDKTWNHEVVFWMSSSWVLAHNGSQKFIYSYTRFPFYKMSGKIRPGKCLTFYFTFYSESGFGLGWNRDYVIVSFKACSSSLTGFHTALE